MLQVIKRLLQDVIDNIDSGNSNADEEELIEIAHFLKVALRKDEPMSKYQAYTYLNMSRATFDNYIRDGLIPPGIKIPGLKELIWYKKDLKNITKKRPSQ